PHEPGQMMANPHDALGPQVFACGPAGSVIIFNASAWHGHGANQSGRPRRSIQAHFVPRAAQASFDHFSRMRPETLLRLGGLAKYLLNIGASNKPIHATCEDARA
ncbi:MAG TPA: hypothetical protein VFS47_04320, partial [Steroidobacteraceae bacterium]|nr:hypothetical protein [Steroidobacteraceae bacterium]